MKSLPEDKMLYFNTDTIEFVRKIYNLDKPERMKESIDLLAEWIQQQSYFIKKDYSRTYLEHTLIGSKGSLERSKETLDRGCTLRTLMPEYFQDFDVKNDFNFFKQMSLVVLPKVTKNHERVFLLGEIAHSGHTQKMFLDAEKYAVMLAEYIRAYDCVSAYHIVYDLRVPNLAELIALTSIVDLRKLAVILIEGYGVRLKGFHILTDSKFIDIILSIGKQVMPKKLTSRIFVHKALEDVHKLVDKDVLPVEFGGKEKPLKELNEDWIETISSTQFREYWREMCEARTDESKRQSSKFNDQYMGMPGSFRSLSVD